MSTEEKNDKDHEHKDKGKHEKVEKKSKFTGDGFIAIPELEEIVEAYRQRTEHFEDLQVLPKKGGLNWLADKLQTDLKEGIKSATIEARVKAYGYNQLETDPPATFWELLFDALKDLTLIILMIAAVASIIINMIVETDHRDIAWIEGFAILMAVAVSSLVQAINNWQKQKEFDRLNEEAGAAKGDPRR